MVETNFTVVVGGSVVNLILASVVVGGRVVNAALVVVVGGGSVVRLAYAVVVAGGIVVVVGGCVLGTLRLGCNVDMMELKRAGKNVVDRTVVVGSLSGFEGFNVVSISGGNVLGTNVIVVGGSVVVFLVVCGC